MLTVKRRILGEDYDDAVGTATVVHVEADLSVASWEEKLVATGFDPKLPSAWILEGLSM